MVTMTSEVIEVENTTRGRARHALQTMEEIAAMPLSVVDPLAMVRLLQWVLDGEPRPIPAEMIRARNDRLVAAMRAGAPWTISAPSIGAAPQSAGKERAG